MNDQSRYETVDLPFYKEEIAPILPANVLDFHTHTWKAEHWKETFRQTATMGSNYMAVPEQYDADELLRDGRMLFPDRPYSAVCFGWPTPASDVARANAYSLSASVGRSLYPLMVAGRDLHEKAELERVIAEGRFFGYKVFLNWHGNDYGAVAVEDMIGPTEMELADRLKLIVLIHVPRDGRLADPEVQRGVRKLSQDYPGARIVLAHCGRAYLPDEMRRAISSVKDLKNVYMDTAMVMDPTVLQIVFDNIGFKRVLFGTDLPVAGMRGRRVYAMDHWVDIVLEGYPSSDYRVASNNMRATFMVYEIVLAIRRGAEMAGLSSDELQAVFHDNGMALLKGVMDGERIRSHRIFSEASH